MTDAPQVPAGWYADSTDASKLRYWDGSAWTDNWAPAVTQAETETETGAETPSAASARNASDPAPRRTVPISTWVIGAILLVILLVSLLSNIGTFLLLLGLIALITGAYVLLTRKRSWALLPATRATGAAVLGAGLVVAIVGGAVIGATARPAAPRQVSASATSAAPTPTPSPVPETVAPSAISTPTAAPTVVPNLVGMKGDEARAALSALGLDVDWSEAVIIAGNWTVDAQVPAAGGTAVPGSKILLTVSKHDAAQAEVPAPASAAPAQPAAPAAPAAPAVSAAFRSALSKAGSYSDTLHMSKSGIYDQLTSDYGEQFAPDAAQYAVDNVKADWNANALAKAKDYQETMSMSPEAIRDQLTSEYGEKFTADEADYAIQHLND